MRRCSSEECGGTKSLKTFSFEMFFIVGEVPVAPRSICVRRAAIQNM